MKYLSMLLCLTFLLQGCSATEVALQKLSFNSNNAPASSAETVIIVTLADKRGIDVIGITGEGTEISAVGNIPEWTTDTLAVLLQKAGLQVSVAKTKEIAMQNKPNILITGEVKKIHLESSFFKSTASIEIKLITVKNSGEKRTEILTASVSEINNPFGDTEAKVLLLSLEQAYSNYIQQFAIKNKD